MTTVLPPGACLLHVGPYKTGSSSIQSALHHRRPELREHGVLYAGSTARARRPGWAVIGVTPRGRRTATIDEWIELADEVRAAADLRVCVSTEDLARVDPSVARRVVADLGPDRIHVLTVVRRLDRLLPSQWQQRAQSFKTDSYEEYLHVVLDPDGPVDHQSRRAFWASHDVAKVLGTWSDAAGAERVVAVVADETDRALLPRTFEELLGLPDGLLQQAPSGNPSLSYNAVELLRRLNVVAEERGWPDEIYSRVLREVAHEMKYAGGTSAGRTPLDVAVPRLPAWAERRVRELSEQRADALVAAGVRVVGDPDTLRRVEAQEAGARPVDTVSVDAVVRAVKGVVTADRRSLASPSPSPSPSSVGRSLGDVPTRELLGLLGGRAAARLRRVAR